MAPIPRIEDYPARQSPRVPIISVITTIRNGVKTLPRTIESIRAQNIPDLEYIVVDAGSTDGTQGLLAANGDIVTFWQSEPDKGISDGFNKGIALSTGRYVAIVNADDWLSPGQLKNGVETLERTGADFVFGDLMYHGSDGSPLYRIKGDPNYAKHIGHVMPALNHPTVIVRRKVYERHGLVDLTLRYAMDYDLLLRFHRGGCIGVYDPNIVGHMSLAGASDTWSLRAIGEVRDISIRHGYPHIPAYVLYGFRLAKDRIRRIAERLLAPRLSGALRRLVNKDIVRIK